mgnify:FL=1
MKAAVYTRYGGPDVVTVRDVPDPTPGPGEILVETRAAGVTTADWRLRAAAFPGLVMGIAGRVMFGITGPRNPVLGSDFAGVVAETGAGVTEFRPGDRVFGFSDGGAHAERLVMKADKAVTRLPEALSFAEGAALPFGAMAALEFLDRFAALKPGEHVLIVGASGGVGAYAVQIARALGAEVTAVASGARAAMLTGLGADHVIDYRARAAADWGGPFDVIFDTIGVTNYAQMAAQLADGGRFVPLNFGIGDFAARGAAKKAGHAVILQVNADTKAGLERLVAMIAEGRLRPVIDSRFAFADIRDAHAKVETRSRAGAVIVTF